MAFLATPGVDCEAYFIGRFKLGVGDHRGPHVLDVPIACILGTDEIRPRSLEGRKLQVKDVPRCRKKYNADLKQVTADHNRNFAVASVDLGQCYDAVNHAFCSIALQAFGVPLKAIRLMLLTLQTMKF